MARIERDPLIRYNYEDSGFIDPLDISLNEEEARRLAEAYRAGDPEVIDTILRGEDVAEVPVERFRSFTDIVPTNFSQVGAPALQQAVEPVVQPAVEPLNEPVREVSPAPVQDAPNYLNASPNVIPVREQQGVDDYFAKSPVTLPNIESRFDANAQAEVAPVSPEKQKELQQIDALAKQILDQGTTAQWTGVGYGSAEANAKDMAKILAGIGITDINQFGPITREVQDYVGSDDSGNAIYQTRTEQTYGNTATGQAVPLTYGGRQTGNAFGGTYEGKGNTGYRVDFSTGKPIFYTTGASSNTLVNLFADNPLLGKVATAAAAFYGGPAGVAALQAAQGKSIQDIAKSALLAYAGGQVAQSISGSAELVNSIGTNATNILARGAGNYVSSEGKANIIDSIVGGTIDLGVNQVASLIPEFTGLTQGQQDFTKNVIRTTIQNGGDLSISALADAAITAGMAAAKASATETLKTAIDADSTINNAVNNAAGIGGETEDPNRPSAFANREINSSITMPELDATITASPLELPPVTVAPTETAVTVDPLEEIKGMRKFNDAYAAARKLLGPNQTFEWNGKKFSTATAQERPDLNVSTIDQLNKANLATATDASRTVAAQSDVAARATAAEELAKQQAAQAATEKTGFFTNLANAVQNQMKLSSDAANEYLKENPDSPITNSVSTAMEAAGNLQKNVAGGAALMLDNKPLADALVKSGDDLAKFGQSIGSGVVDTKNWNDTMGLLEKAEGWEKLGVMAGRIMDGTSGLGRQVQVELRQELPGLFLGGGSIKGILVATGLMDTAETAGNAALNTYDDAVKQGKSHADALSDARKAGAVAGMTEAAIQLTLGKVADVVIGKVGNVGARATGRVFGEGLTEAGQEGASSLAVNAALGQELDINKALTQAVAGSAVGKGTAVTTSPADIATSETINNAISTAVTTGDKASVNTAITSSVQQSLANGTSAEVAVGSAVNSAITNGADPDSSITSAVSSAITSGADTSETVTSSIDSAITAGADTTTAINSTVSSAITSGADFTQTVSSSITAATTAGVNPDTAITNTVTSAINASITGGTDASTSINTAVTSAITTAATSNVNASTAVTSAVDSAVATAITNNVNPTTAITTSITAAINASVNVDPNVASTTAVEAAVSSAVNAGVDTNTAVNAAVNAVVNANINPNININIDSITQTATNTATSAKEKADLISSVNNLISGEPTTEPTAPTKKSKKKQSGEEALAGGFTFSGSGVIDPLKESFLKTYMTKDSFKDPLERLREMQGTNQLADNQMMQQQIDPYLARVLSERNTPEVQPESPPLWSFGQEPDSIDAMLPEAPQVEKAFKSGGFVAPLQMASGGSMALPLLAKSGGALGALPREDGRMDFRHGAHVAGEGDGQSDDIKAMLADGEFVFPADVVSALGNGSTKAGSDKLYEMMHAIRDRARSTGTKDLPPPALKSPLDYLKKGSKK